MSRYGDLDVRPISGALGAEIGNVDVSTPLDDHTIAQIRAAFLDHARAIRRDGSAALDLCAVSLPCGFTHDGLPIGLQLIGHPHDEARLLRLGRAFEQATDFHRQTPDLEAFI